VKGVKGRSLRLLSLIPVLIISLAFMINLATAPITLPNVYIDPPEVSGNPGDAFSINVYIEDVVDLFSFDVRIQWPNGLLQVVSVTEGPFIQSVNPTIFIGKLYADYCTAAVTTLGAVPGVSGAGILCTVNFNVLDAGTCALDIYQSTLLDSTLTAMSHTSADGYFYTTAEANLVKKSAWPEHHHFDVSKDEDGYQNLTGKVKNLGPLDLKVSVEFSIVRDDGSPSIIQTPTQTVLAGTEVDLVAMYGPLANLDAGKYYVNASCMYSYTGTYWAQGTKSKAFSFAVVP